MLFDKYLSIIIQGPIKLYTDYDGYSTIDVITSAREVYPNAEIIYSGWENTSLPDWIKIKSDIVVLSKDPGSIVVGYANGNPIIENINRQIVSTLQGLVASTRQICIKTRSDMLFTHPIILPSEWDSVGGGGSGGCIFQKPILISSRYTRFYFVEYGIKRKSIAHVSDLFHLGLRDDLIKYWDGPLVSESKIDYGDINNKPTPEQLLCLRFIAKFVNNSKQIILRSKFDTEISGLSYIEYVNLFFHNFIPLPENQLGIKLPRRFIIFGITRWINENKEGAPSLLGCAGKYMKVKYHIKLNIISTWCAMKWFVRRIIGNNIYSSITKSYINIFMRR